MCLHVQPLRYLKSKMEMIETNADAQMQANTCFATDTSMFIEPEHCHIPPRLCASFLSLIASTIIAADLRQNVVRHALNLDRV